MPAFLCSEVDRVGVLRVQEAPSALGTRESVLNVFDGLCMELATSISGDDNHCGCVSSVICQVFYEVFVYLSLWEFSARVLE
eukprot:560051-Pelagomonas_calceolata.AAC.1